MTDKTTNALKLAEKALEGWKEYDTWTDQQMWNDDDEEALAAIREALSGHSGDANEMVMDWSKVKPEAIKSDPMYRMGYAAAMSKFAAQFQAEHVKQEPVAHKWPLMGYGNVAIGGCKQPDGTSGLIYLDMGETREIDADTTDLFPVGSEADPSKLLACIYFKDGSAIQQTIDVLHEMQIETAYAAPVSAKREWVDLTDDEMWDVFISKDWTGEPLQLMSAVITAFKEKNK